MKVCFILENFYPKIGGHEKLFLTLCRGLIKKGHEVRVVTMLQPNSSEREEHFGIQIYRYQWMKLFGHALPFGRITRDIKEHVQWSDIVHTSTYSAAPPAHKMAKQYDKPCVLTSHEYLGDKWYWITNPLLAMAFKTIERWVVHRDYSAYHVISEATKRDIVRSGIPESKVRRIYPGIDDLDFENLPEANIRNRFQLDPKDRVFLFFGRYGKPKGLPVLLEAIRLLKNKIDDTVKFCFIVDNASALKKDIRSVGIEDKCLVKSSVEWKTLMAFVKTADTVIVPSYTEGFGFTTTETCTIGTPIVASDAGSIPEVIWGKHLLFENRNSKDLAKKIKMAIGGKFEHREPRSFKWQEMVDEIEKIYGKISD